MNWLYKNKHWIYIAIIATALLLLIPHRHNFTVEGLLGYVPSSIALAILVFALIYAVKAVVMFPPLKVLYIAAGIVFPAGWGVVITYLCLVIALTIGYSVGKALGEEEVHKIITKNKKLASLLDEGKRDSLPALCFIARVLPVPRDLFSMLCGAVNMPYWKYLVASLLGLSTFMVPVVLTSAAVSSLESSGLILPIVISIVASIIGIGIYAYTKKTALKSFTGRLRLHPIKIAASAIIISFIAYLAFALLPYTGSVYVSQETRDAFVMEDFFGQYEIPERVMLLEEPRDAFFHRINLISKAKDQIYFAAFAITQGTTGDIFVGAMLHAAERGIRVSIINDGIVGAMPSSYRNVLSAHENIDVYLFSRFELLRPHYTNTALHDKYMTVDNRFVIYGGRNIGDRFFNLEGFTGHVANDREVLVYNSDPDFTGVIAQTEDYFYAKANSRHTHLVSGGSRDSEWEAQRDYFIGRFLEYKEGVARDFNYLANTTGVNRITLLTNPYNTGKNEATLAYNLMMLTKNSDVIIAQSPYLVLTRRNLEIFADMVRDRDFTLSTNSLAATSNLPAFSAYYANRRSILATGITIYEYQDTRTSLHGKTYLFDGRLTAIGSFNLNERSIRSDTESMLVIDSVEFFDIALDAINCQLSRSLRVGADNRYEFSYDIDAAHVSLVKRILYTVAGYVLTPFRFMF